MKKTLPGGVQHKHFLRLHYREKARAIPFRRRRMEASRAARRLAGLPDFKTAATVGLYLSLPHEMDTGPLFEIALKMGKTVVVPVVSPANRELSFVHWEPGAPMVRNVHGIPEPRKKRRIPIQGIQFLVVPGAAFTKDGRRLGSGGGYYDRLLAGPHPFTAGYAFEEQIALRLPFFVHDKPVDVIVTPAGVLKCKSLYTPFPLEGEGRGGGGTSPSAKSIPPHPPLPPPGGKESPNAHLNGSFGCCFMS